MNEIFDNLIGENYQEVGIAFLESKMGDSSILPFSIYKMPRDNDNFLAIRTCTAGTSIERRVMRCEEVEPYLLPV